MSSPSYGAPNPSGSSAGSSSPASSTATAKRLGMDPAEASRLLGEAIGQVQRVIVGQEHMVEQLMVGLLAKGHILL